MAPNRRARDSRGRFTRNRSALARLGTLALQAGALGATALDRVYSSYAKLPAPVKSAVSSRVGKMLKKGRKSQHMGAATGISSVGKLAPVRQISPKDLRCVTKSKFSGTTTQNNTGTLYQCHATHPPKYVLRHLCMSLLEMYFRDVGVPIQAWNSSLSPFSHHDTQAFELRMIFQTRNDADLQFDNLICTQNATYLEIADEMANFIISKCSGAAVTDFKIIQLSMGVRGNPATLPYDHPLTYYLADCVKIGIYGVSKMDWQNRTLAGGGTSTDSALSIYNNPLEGRIYECTGFNAIIQNSQQVEASKEIPFQNDVTTGTYANRSAGSTIPTALVDILTEPPHPRFFKNITKSGFIKIMPGEIKTHVLKSYVKKSLNGWIASIRNWMLSGNTLDGTRSAPGATGGAVIQRTSNFTGKNAVCAVSKACDLGSATLVLANEKEGYMASKAWYKPFHIIPATNDNMEVNAAPA